MLSLSLWARPGLADEADVAGPLIGSLPLPSFEFRIVDEDGPPRRMLGEHPSHRIVLTPAHRVIVFISSADKSGRSRVLAVFDDSRYWQL